MELILRKATEADCDLLYEWANDPVVRAAAFHTEPIPYKSHVVWFRDMMNDPMRYQYILCEKTTYQPVAQIRLALEGNEALISYSVGREYRGLGVGTKLIELAEKAILAEPVQIRKLVAQVKYENPASARIFEKHGYILEEKKDYKEFTRNISNLFIRADGNATVGLGHVMRCLSIADEASKLGMRVSFITADNCATELIWQRGYTSYQLNTDYRDMESELPILSQILEKQANADTDICMVDSYRMTAPYLEAIRKFARVAVLDDLFLMDYPVDCVINYNLYGDLLQEKLSAKHDRKLLTGVLYAPLREQFLQKRKEPAETLRPFGEGLERKEKHILISTGGSDSLHLAKRIADALLSSDIMKDEQKPVMLDIVCGSMNPNKEELLALWQEHASCVKLHVDVKDMAELMTGCTMAITAAGSTVYELSTLGIPFVLYYFVENQKLIAEYAAEILGVVNAGDFSDEKTADACMQSILLETKHLLTNETDRKKLSQTLFELVDGRGAERIAKELHNL